MYVSTNCAAGAGVFELQILEFSNYRAALASGACCGGGARAAAEQACAAPCRTRFTLCLKEYQSAAAPGACSFGRAASPVLGTDSFTLAEPLYTLALPFSFRWTRSFTLILQAYDDFEYSDPEAGLVEEAWWSGIVEPSAEWHALQHAGAAAAVAYRVRVLCQPNYYNTTCTTFCRPRDDKFGHYSCTAEGDKRCLPGWQGDNCEKPVCKEGCHPTHGRCDRPGDCDCRPGWRGELCAQCQPYPGCKHGYCNGSSWDCTCDTNWGGILCDQDVNECEQRGAEAASGGPEGALGPCVNAAACNNTAGGYSCACLAGWTGRDCEANVDDCTGQCLNGATCIDLVDDFHCACAAGYSGRTCALDVDDCAPRPCRNGGECVDLLNAYRCICPVGFSGTNCELTSCYGRYCVDDRDHCAGAPCGNGAACYTAQSDYYCHCAPGWTGKNCTQRAAKEQVNECASSPCRNNGSCVDGTADFTCICRDGWTGKTCSIRVDGIEHCPEGTCANGGTCVREGGGWRCVCAGGWAGAACDTAPAPAAPACPCAAGGTCVPTAAPPGWACACREGRTGARCELAAEPCASAPCRNGGRCVGGAGWWACECAAGWSGDTCSVRACAAACPPAAACVADPLRPERGARCVCVPSAPALCLRGPCAALGECRRVAGRRVEPPALPAPPACWPGARARVPPGCARATLQLARERLARGAHVERACAALRRALAAALAATSHGAPPAPPLALLCDLAADDDDALDLALWIGDEVGTDGTERAEALGAAVRALSDLVARRRLAQHALLGAALRLRVPAAPALLADPSAPAPALTMALAALGLLILVAVAAALVFWLRRRRAAAAAERSRRCDEEKSNNLQNEENLRRYANPLRDEPAAGAARRPADELPRAHSLYKAQNADARNDTPPRDKELTKRALPPPEPPPTRHAPPERLTVLV
ncbi:unnamed protein product [Spodoptera littoralis]|uniref:Delta-like protein n=1 Tax=Spodoptera littoralis TaxID=7109 RepID=A0A9P0I0M6_SPOLI|nr:unnamed protein product [Spodoptera littoralis]CAH1637990.1 unnamed protein product [Spodoptera littoralis]